uniref:IFT121 second beta-propeller domain-containing protein n=1 Tax=Panagrolaimus davidi TaxID=227884 RepID=A0A914QRS2_9BILA
MSLNCSSTRLAVISTNNIFKLFDIRENGTQVVSGFEKKDIWDMKWDNDKEDTIAIMEKSRLLVVQGTTAADPVPNQGYICSFRDLTVRTIQMQYVMQNPKDFDRGLIADIEVKVRIIFVVYVETKVLFFDPMSGKVLLLAFEKPPNLKISC